MQLEFETVQFQDEPKASVIWLHGLGASKEDFIPAVPHLEKTIQHPIRFIFPQAPLQAVSINQGTIMPAWYDIFSLDFAAREDKKGLDASRELIRDLIQQEYAQGIPLHKILLVGFSQGGALALHTAYHFSSPLAGVVALSTYLPLYKAFPQDLSEAMLKMPVFWGHGQVDDIVPIYLGEKSRHVLESHRILVDWHAYPMRHEVCEKELHDLDLWIENKLFSSKD